MMNLDRRADLGRNHIYDVDHLTCQLFISMCNENGTQLAY